MRRRGNKSNKVPNVKLRPAEQGLTPRPSFDDCWAQETQLGSDDTIPLDRCPRPFRGLVICATGIPDKPTLFKQAVELGATHTPAFTDRVTHLIAIDHGGPKYSCAVERKVPIVKPSWITENYQIWLRGDDVDAHKCLEDYRLPTFSGIVVCSSGINDITRRTEISKLVTAHGGTYVTKLERPVKVTHLLCSGDEETDKMRYAEKFNNKREANIQLVWEEWFWDSLHYGGRFEEATYQVRRPRPEPKPVPATATPPPSSSDAGSQGDLPSSSEHQRPPANENDEPEDEPAFVNVLPAVTLQLWNSLLERRGYQITDGEVILSPKADSAKAKVDLPNSPHRPQISARESIISSFRRANSFAPVARVETGPSRAMPFKRAATSAAVFAGHDAQAGPSAIVIAPPKPGLSSKSKYEVAPLADSKTSVPTRQIFAGMVFRVLGEAKIPTVRQAIEEQGGRISTDDDEDVTFTIVRLVSGSKIYRQEDDETARKKYRTECWLEHCLYEERLCAPDEHICFLPLSISIPVDGAEQIMMCLSGFDESNKHSLNRLLRALGITSTPLFNRRNTHLLCQSATGPKYEKAQEWGIPVVSLEWLKHLVETGRIPNTATNKVPQCGVAGAGDLVEVEMVDDISVKGKLIDKGKGKATSVELDGAMDLDSDKMQDITNSPGAEQHSKLQPKKSGVTGLERLNTVILPAPKPPEKRGFMFGQPSDILSGSSSSRLEEHRPDSALRMPVISPNPSIASLQDGPGTRPGSFTMSSGIQQASLQGSGPQEGRIPSSTTPSPMKPPSLQKGDSSRQSLSPVKVDHEATKALQDSIASLLGKRPSPDVDDLPTGVGATGRAKGSRPGKRVRPQRSKPQVKQSSDPPKVEQHRVQTRSSAAAAAAALRLDAVAYVEPLNPFGSYPDEVDLPDNAPPESQHESIRVTYEDPGQRDEKQRLMNILKGKSSQGESLDRITRRSQRIPGF